MDTLIETVIVTDKYPIGHACEMYVAAPASSPMRRLLVYYQIWQGDSSWLYVRAQDNNGDADVDTVPKGFFIYMAEAFLDLNHAGVDDRSVVPWVRDCCRYYE